jgi:glycosyltransferase involved in cell wall biosynthesis
MISVVIPIFNNAIWLSSCLQSCMDQGSLLKEVIVIDDHSTDKSWEVIEKWQLKFPNKIKLYRNLRKGANHARNFGFEQSVGQYIQWLDSDDMLLPGKFENQIIPLLNGEADIVYSDWRIDYWEGGAKIKTEEKEHQVYEDFLEEILKDNWTSPNNYLMSRQMAEKLSKGVGWNPNTKVGQDREYFTMAGILGARFKYVPGTFAVYNSQSAGTISGMDFKLRLIHNQILEERFREEINNQRRISKFKKTKYKNILDTHKLKACFYHPKIMLDRPIKFFSVRWSLMHWKMRIPILFIYIFKHFQYFIKH